MTNGTEHPDGWTAQLPDDLKSNEAFTGFEKIGDFATAYLEQGKAKTELDGKLANSVQLLKDDATDEEKADFFNKIGRPEAPDNYEFQRPELPDDIPYNEDLEKEFRSIVHGAGLTKTQAGIIYNWFHSTGIDADKARKAADQKFKEMRQKEAVDSLKKEWGEENYGKNVEIANRAVKAVESEGVKDFKSYLDESGFGDNLKLIEAFYIIGTKILDDTTLPGAPPGEKGLNATPEGKSAAEEKVLEYPSMEK